MCIVDVWLAFYGCRGGVSFPTTRRELYNDIVEQLIDKSYDGLGQCNYDGGMASPSKAPANDHLSGIDAHLNLTKLNKITREGVAKKYTMQGRCMECNFPGTAQVC